MPRGDRPQRSHATILWLTPVKALRMICTGTGAEIKKPADASLLVPISMSEKRDKKKSPPLAGLYEHFVLLEQLLTFYASIAEPELPGEPAGAFGAFEAFGPNES